MYMERDNNICGLDVCLRSERYGVIEFVEPIVSGSVSFGSSPERVQYHVLSEYVVSNAVVTKANSPLALSSADTGKLLDIELAGYVVRVFG
jgi:hypothetical protein